MGGGASVGGGGGMSEILLHILRRLGHVIIGLMVASISYIYIISIP